MISPVRAQEPDPASAEGVFLEAWRVTANAFYDASMNGVDWNKVRDELQPKARASASAAELSAVINDALAQLHASHTEHYFQDQREYYELLSVFFPEGVPARPGSKITPGPVQYVGIGLAATMINGRAYAADVYDGGPAADAGILAGDELIAVEGGPWGDVAPFREREGKPTKVTIQRSADASSRRDVMVTPVMIRPRELFLKSVEKSARLIEREGKQIGYVRVRSYASPLYHEAVKDLLAEKLANADGLVIDIRGGWGGANPSYMDIFNPTAPSLLYQDRQGKERTVSPTWRKPVAMLIDGGSRSGKEVLAYAFKKHKIGVLVGERTAGAVLAGTPRPLADGSVLYIAVGKVLVDGETIEGIGVEPDVVVKRELPYCAGWDAQVEAAVGVVAKSASTRK